MKKKLVAMETSSDDISRVAKASKIVGEWSIEQSIPFLSRAVPVSVTSFNLWQFFISFVSLL